MKKILGILFVCLFMVSCDEPRPTCVVIDKQCIEHRITSNEYYLITRSIYNNKKKIAPVGKEMFILYNIGDTIPEPFSAHE